MKIKEKAEQHDLLMEEYATVISRRRGILHEEKEGLECDLQVMLDQMSRHKEEMYFQPLRGEGRIRKGKVVYFNQRLHFSLHDRDGVANECKKLLKLFADRTAKVSSEWVLEDVYGNVVLFEDLSTEELLYLADRLFDKDCSLDINWTDEVAT